MNNTPQDLTIAIPVRNEEKNLPGCLEAIGKDFARKIVIIDSGSSDATLEIAKNFGVDVIHFQWNGKFPKKRNWYLQNHPPETKWILFLDADEYLTEHFKTDARKALASNKYVGYWLNYSIYFQGIQLKGGYPLTKLALFRVGSGEYEKIEEQQWSQLDMEIHEHPILTGKTGKIRSKIDHRDFRGVSHYVKKHDEYANWEAHRFLKFQTNLKNKASLTMKQKIKYKLMQTPLVGPMFFMGSFVLMGGFRDGATGLAFGILKASYFTQIYCKIQELRVTYEQ